MIEKYRKISVYITISAIADWSAALLPSKDRLFLPRFISPTTIIALSQLMRAEPWIEPPSPKLSSQLIEQQ
jgi:hypothetical protein